MKRGPEVNHFEQLPEEIFTKEVLKYLPAYSFRGNNSIRNVCQDWNVKAGDYKKITIKEIVNSCEGPEDALAILKDESLLTQLTFENIMKIVGMHPGLVSQVIAQLDRASEDFSFTIQLIFTLARCNVNMANKILETSVFRDMLRSNPETSSECLYDLGMIHLPLIQVIFNDPELFAQLNERHLVLLKIRKLIEEFPAEKIPDDLICKLSSDDLTMIGNKLPIAQQILGDMNLCRKLDAKQLAHIRVVHFQTAMEMWNNRVISKKEDFYEISVLGRVHFEIAELILKEKKLREYLDSDVLCELGRSDPSIAMLILKEEDLCKKLNGFDLSELGCLGFKVAKHILDNKVLFEKLGEFDILKLGKAYLPIAQIIFEDLHKLNKRELFELGEAHLSIAELILNDERLCEKLGIKLLMKMKLKHVSLFKGILEESPSLLLEHLYFKELYSVNQNFILARLLLGNSTLRARLGDTNELTLKVKLVDFVMDCVKNINKTRQQPIPQLTVNADAMDLEDDAQVVSPSTPRLQR